MRGSFQALGLVAGLLAVGCGGGDDDFVFPGPNPVGPVTAVFVQAGASGDGSTAQAPSGDLVGAQALLQAAADAGQPTTLTVLPGTSPLAGNIQLRANQTLTSSSGSPVLSGTVTLANNTTVSNLAFVGTSGDAIVGNGVVDFTLSGLTVANTTANAINLTNTGGTAALTNLNLSNLGGAGVPITTNAGAFNLVASNWTVTNTVGNATQADISGNAVVNAQFTGLIFTNLGASNPTLANSGTGFEWTTRSTSNVTLRITDYSQDTGGDGVFFTSTDDSRTAIIVSNANITNGISRGLTFTAEDNSVLKARVTNSTLLNNFSGFLAQSGASADLAARLVGNISDDYQFIGIGALPIRVENLGNLGDPGGENTGSVDTTGSNVQDVGVDTAGIPQ